MNKSILIVCVNYNSYKELVQYLSSIEIAAQKTKQSNIHVIVADNSTKYETHNVDEFRHINVQIQKQNNVGYLIGAQTVINSIPNILDYDYIAISNVDITMSEDFFVNIEKSNMPGDVAWIAPKIYSKDENRDRNPKVMSRYSKKKLKLLYYMYKFPILFYLYTMTAYKRKKLQPKYPEMDIYAGHGSFMLLTRSFFESYKKIEYPIFLFGEELYLAELVMNVGKKVRYVPSIVIEDNEHVSTSTLKKNTYFKYNQESIKYILDTFYNE